MGTVHEVERKSVMKELAGRGCPPDVRELIVRTAKTHGVSLREVVFKSRTRCIVRARDEAIYEVKRDKPMRSLLRIGRWFDRDHTTVMASIARHAALTGQPSYTSSTWWLRRDARRVCACKRKAMGRTLRQAR